MSGIVRDVSLAGKIAACEDNFAAFVLHFARLAERTGSGASSETAELAWGISGLPIDLFNGIVRTRWEGETDEADLDAHIETALAPFRGHVAPMAWWVTPSSQPTHLAARLEAHGLRYVGDDPAMAVDLLALPERVATPEDVEIVEVTELAGLRQAVDVLCAGFGAPAAFGVRYFALLAQDPLEATQRYRTFLARRGGMPVATSQLLLADGIAGIYAVATLPEARRLGIGAAVTLAPLLAARGLGYRLGILTASKLGYGVYQRLGFEELCRFSSYTLAGESAEH